MKTAILSSSFIGTIIATIYLWLKVPSDKLLNRILWGENEAVSRDMVSLLLDVDMWLVFLVVISFIDGVVKYYYESRVDE